jgi:anti-anti-sigma regulatory factor
VADLSHCTFVGSATIRALLTAAAGTQQRGGLFELVLMFDSRIRRTLQIAGVLSAVRCHSSRADAVASVDALRPALRSALAGKRRGETGTQLEHAA